MNEPLHIESLHNPRVKDLVRLRRRQHRARRKRILIDGIREVSRALEAGLSEAEVFYCPRLCQSKEAAELIAKLDQYAAQRIQVTPQVFEKIAFGHRDEGVVAAAAQPSQDLARITLPETPLVAVLEGCEKPGNLGAVVRSADAAGISAVIAADAVTDIYNPNAIRASLGTIFSMPLAAADSQAVLDWLRTQAITIFAARVDADCLYTAADFRGPAAIVLGAEATGLTSRWSGEDVVPIRLPMLGRADSLNLAATAAVLFYEALRQRGESI